VFDFLSWGHLLVIALAALFIFGPERLPTLAQDAARGLKRLRVVVDATRDQFADAVGDDLGDLRDLDLRRYHPRTFLRDQLFGEERLDGGTSPVSVAASGATASRSDPRRTGHRLPPPFDPEAT
jgi:sec-independent protein translocase protein TatB